MNFEVLRNEQFNFEVLRNEQFIEAVNVGFVAECSDDFIYVNCFLCIHKRASDDSRSSRMVDLKYVLRTSSQNESIGRAYSDRQAGKNLHKGVQTPLAIESLRIGLGFSKGRWSQSVAGPCVSPNLKLRFKFCIRKNFRIKG